MNRILRIVRRYLAFGRLLAATRARVTRSFLTSDGQLIPFGFGIAWYRWQDDTAVVLPMPLNFICGWARILYIETRRALSPPRDRLALERVRSIVESKSTEIIRRQGEQLREARGALYEAKLAAFDAGGEAHNKVMQMMLDGADQEFIGSALLELRRKATGSLILTRAEAN